jgi:Ras-related protein Rab-21
MHIILLGDPCVGKTSLVVRYIEGRFRSYYEPTHGIETSRKCIGPLQVFIHEYTGHASHIIHSECVGAMIVFDVCNPASFDHVESWRSKVLSAATFPVHFLLIGNKNDQEPRAISLTTASTFAKTNHMKYVDVSIQDDPYMGSCISEWLENVSANKHTRMQGETIETKFRYRSCILQ